MLYVEYPMKQSYIVKLPKKLILPCPQDFATISDGLNRPNAFLFNLPPIIHSAASLLKRPLSKY